MENSKEPLILRCLLDGVGFMYPISKEIGMENLREEIIRRHKLRKSDDFRLTYSTPGCNQCLLESEVDLTMLFFAVKLYKLETLDIIVQKGSGSVNGKSSLGINNFVSEGDEEQYLGPAFKTASVMSFLSDEWATYITGEGQCFEGGTLEFRVKIKKYAIQLGFFFFFDRNDIRYISLVCEDMECGFYIKGSVSSINGCFYIDQCDLVHSCNSVKRKSKHRFLDSDVVSSCILNEVMYDLTIRPKDIMGKFKLNYGFLITYKVAAKARYKAIEQIFGKEDESFNKLIWYRDAVLTTNPGSIFDLEVDSLSHRFKRVFVAYGGCIRGFQNSLPVLYVDGCFGKSSYKGQILAATSKNGNKGIYPVAICICDSESEDNWVYFCTHLKKIIDQTSRVVTFISDRGIGLLSAFDMVFPDNPHLYCYFHLVSNLKTRITGKGSEKSWKVVREAFFKCAYSSSEKEYNVNLNVLRFKGGPAVIDVFLRNLPVERWCRAFAVGSRFGIMANSLAESFNSWIIVERAMPVYTLLEEVRLKQMEMINTRRIDSISWTSKITPAMEVKLTKHIDQGRRFRVVSSSDGVFEVRDIYSYEVNLNVRTCSCIKWQINCFPCAHATAAILSLGNSNVYDYVDDLFLVSTFRRCYDCSIVPISNVDEAVSEYGLPHVEVPYVKSPPGRRRKRRFKSAGEVEKKKLITCGRCKKKGHHNSKSCTEPVAGVLSLG